MARLAGVRLPLRSTLIINGDWSIAATPQLNGTIHVRRERGDLFASEDNPDLPAGIALGISTLFEGYIWSLPALAGLALVIFGNLVMITRPG